MCIDVKEPETDQLEIRENMNDEKKRNVHVYGTHNALRQTKKKKPPAERQQ